MLERGSLPGNGLDVREGALLEGGLVRLPVVFDFAMARANRSCKRSFFRALEELRDTAGRVVSRKPLEIRMEASYNSPPIFEPKSLPGSLSHPLTWSSHA
jgi:hypothetical protein